eukprot:CAMPEP_0114267226 /NCGR_PEP_ID=MMETSP0058-20121206/25139_1 /TAXON_ID=36894 /ORGANISM="Pyramimonas parkeae, CCMP726" /LENGTH=204 /DNA_ID=CAMNT_0001384977 /DNA_START=18 /DNA_END=629 /DNA_ORIENTATION=+
MEGDSICSTAGYLGGKVLFMNEETLVYSTGSALLFLNIRTGTQVHHWTGDYSSIVMFAVNRSKNLFCVSQHQLQATIQVYSYQSFKPVAKLVDGEVEIRFNALAFSECGTYIMAIGDAPKFMLSVWDWEKGVLMASVSVPEELASGNASFLDGDQLAVAVVGLHAARVYVLKKMLGRWNIFPVDVDVYSHGSPLLLNAEGLKVN